MLGLGILVALRNSARVREVLTDGDTGSDGMSKADSTGRTLDTAQRETSNDSCAAIGERRVDIDDFTKTFENRFVQTKIATSAAKLTKNNFFDGRTYKVFVNGAMHTAIKSEAEYRKFLEWVVKSDIDTNAISIAISK